MSNFGIWLACMISFTGGLITGAGIMLVRQLRRKDPAS
jgi:hypothetical protein